MDRLGRKTIQVFGFGMITVTFGLLAAIPKIEKLAYPFPLIYGADSGTGALGLYSVKTRYLYIMSSRLVNVRLDEERVRKVAALREQGLALSDVVREAIDERFEKLNRSRKVRDVKNVIQRIFEQYPDPAGLPPRNYDVRDRKAARNAILQTLPRQTR